MDHSSHAGQSANDLEDRLRRMILLNGSIPDGPPENTRARVRLPPSVPSQQSPSSNSINHPPGQVQQTQNLIWNGSGSGSPASPHNQGFPPSLIQQNDQYHQNRRNHQNGQTHDSHQDGQVHHSHHQIGQNDRSHQGGLVQPPVSAPQYQHSNSRNGFPPGSRIPPGHQSRGPPPQRHGAVGVPSNNGPYPRQKQQRPQQLPLDPAAFRTNSGPQQGPGTRVLFDPNARGPGQYSQHPNQRNFRERQAQYLDQLANVEVAKVDMSQAEKSDKEAFRTALGKVCYEICDADPALPKVSLECFGSFQSGFASANSDMDLVIVVQDNADTSTLFSLLENDLPRALEKKFLQVGFGARLLTRTRVPIIKVCQSPAPDFLEKLREEREKWDALPEEKKYPHLHPNEEAVDEAPPAAQVDTQQVQNGESAKPADTTAAEAPVTEMTTARTTAVTTSDASKPNGASEAKGSTENTAVNAQAILQSKRDQSKTWTRERAPGPLDFPHEGVGIQCDINFFNPLGLHNTQLLRCYSLCDPRVRPMVLFVKSWVKQRKINSSYSGTLSSYGFVLMVLHYLMNVAKPAVLPNLQMSWRPPGCTPAGSTATEVDGHQVDFWRNEDEIKTAVRNGQMSSNKDTLGMLLAGFFQYYSSMGNGPQYRWTQQVLSLRTQHGILTKEQKGWVKAVTEEGEGKKIQHRYLFCIEDPFELTHNVARTVTHNGIVAIRDEFRRAYRILTAIGNGYQSHEGELFAKLIEVENPVPEAHSVPAPKATENAKADPKNRAEHEQENKQDQAVAPQHARSPAQGKLVDPSVKFAKHMSHGVIHSPHTLVPQKTNNVKALNVADQDAFPTLGAASATRRKKSGGNFAAISGDAAQAYLAEVRRKKAEAQAESTAMGAAEAVLSEDD